MSAPRQTVFPFFVGCERSGTTLLRMMFDSHPEIAVPSESYFVAQLYQARRPYREQVPFPATRFAEELLRHRWFIRWNLPPADVTAALSADPPLDYADAVRRVFGLFASAAGKPMYGDKTPVYVLNLPVLADLFPEAKFVHIVRDGRDVALSLRDVGFGPDSVAQGALWWRRRVQVGRASGERLGPGRYMEIRYEDLVEDPERLLRAVCGFLEVAFDHAMLEYASHAPTVLKPGSFRLHPHLLEPPKQRLRDWRVQMDEDDLATFEAVAGDLLTELGYEASGLRPSIRIRARALGVRLDGTTRRQVHRLSTSRVAGAARRLPWVANR